MSPDLLAASSSPKFALTLAVRDASLGSGGFAYGGAGIDGTAKDAVKLRVPVDCTLTSTQVAKATGQNSNTISLYRIVGTTADGQVDFADVDGQAAADLTQIVFSAGDYLVLYVQNDGSSSTFNVQAICYFEVG